MCVQERSRSVRLGLYGVDCVALLSNLSSPNMQHTAVAQPFSPRSFSHPWLTPLHRHSKTKIRMFYARASCSHFFARFYQPHLSAPDAPRIVAMDRTLTRSCARRRVVLRAAMAGRPESSVSRRSFECGGGFHGPSSGGCLCADNTRLSELCHVFVCRYPFVCLWIYVALVGLVRVPPAACVLLRLRLVIAAPPVC